MVQYTLWYIMQSAQEGLGLSPDWNSDEHELFSTADVFRFRPADQTPAMLGSETTRNPADEDPYPTPPTVPPHLSESFFEAYARALSLL